MVPSRFPIAKAFDVLDADMRLWIVAKNLAKQTVFTDDLGFFVDRIVEDLSVHVAENVVTDPAHDLEIAFGERRCENGL